MKIEQYTGAFDGSAKPNPGEMKIGGWIAGPDRRVISEFSENLGYGTNNEAEYNAFIRILEEARKLGIKRISLRGDSQLVVNQINRLWKIKDPRMKELSSKAFSLMEGIEVNLSHVVRKYNKTADSLTR